jgi:adenylylsulfate kinase
MKRACVVWLTGLPASGKSTLAVALRERLGELGVASLLLDSDALRAALHPTPGYDEAGRRDFYGTLADLAALVEAQGLVAVVAATAHLREFRAYGRERARRFIEVYVRCDAAVCAARDPKGLYAASRGGELQHLPGLGVVYEEPELPEVRVDTSAGMDASAGAIEAIADRILGA